METSIYNIKPGHVFYCRQGYDITKYEYLCIFPSTNPKYTTPENYHILINRKTAEPVRVYHIELTRMLNQGLKTYEDAQASVKEYLQQKLNEFQ